MQGETKETDCERRVGAYWTHPILAAGGQISLEISGIVFSFEGSDFQKNV